MGVKNLWDILESCKKTLPLHHLQNKRLCIDLSCWMVQLQNVSKSHNCYKEKVYLKGLFHRIRALIALNCSLIFVTDGSIPAIKLSAYKRRLGLESEQSQVVRDDTNLQDVSSLRRNMGSEFSRMIKEAKVLGEALGIPCLDSIEEAEAQCALINAESLCDGCFSSDSDIFLFGARTVYRDICLNDAGYVVCYEMTDIERQLGFGRNSLIALALLLGCDYSHGVHGFGMESACHIVKSLGDELVLQSMTTGGLAFLKKTKGLIKQQRSKLDDRNVLLNKEPSRNTELLHLGSDDNSQENEQFLQVINAYTKPKCHSADSNAVYRALALHPLQHIKLHQMCAQFFEWPPEKTDEYILPKIAERDLRRFANLRSTFSELEGSLALHKVSVRCPVSEVIKHRKVQGRECFEVSWENVHGLQTSIVPADLLERACPEKIQEFEEKIAQLKKKKSKKPSQRKLKGAQSTAEIDLKLQKLLLDIEAESNYRCNPSLSPVAVPLEDSTTNVADQLDKMRLVEEGSDSEAQCSNYQSCSLARTAVGSSSTSTKEVIDLLSPSPAVGARVKKCAQVRGQPIDVIDLSDSENDISPSHQKKARDLRLFIASIKDDMHE